MKNSKLWKALDGAISILMAICFGSMTLVIFAQVIFRYILKSPLAWSEELARYLFVWVSFIGSVVAARRNQHIGVEMLVNKLPCQIQKIVRILAHLVTALFFGIISGYVIKMMPKLMVQATSALKIPMAIPYLGLLVGCILMTFFYLCEAFDCAIKQEEN